MNRRSNGLTVVPFKKRHLALIQRYLFPYMADIADTKGFWKHGPSFTMFDGDQIVFCAGVAIVADGVGEAWCISDEYAAKIPWRVSRCQTWFIDAIAKKHNLRRIQAWIRADDPRAGRYIRMIGFLWEGTLEKIGKDGADMHIFGRIY